MLNQSKYIKTIPFSGLFNWSVQYLSETKISFNATYPLVRIGEFLKRNKTVVDIQDDMRYTRVTIRVRNGGVTIRDTEIGKNIGTKRQFVVSEGQFILSKIDARNGAMGIIPAELNGAIVTQDFLPYDIDTAKINPQYLVLVSTTAEFVAFCQTCSSGTTNRQRIEEAKFLDIKIPLPSLDEQNALVAAYNELIETANSQELQAQSLEKQIETYLLSTLKIKKQHKNIETHGLQLISYKELHKWAISEIFKSSMYSFDDVEFELKSVGQLLTFFDGGKTPSTSRKDYWGNDIYWASAKDMKELYLTTISDKISHKGADESGLKIYPEGTILGVFRSGILRHSFPICLTMVPTTINQDLKAIGVNESVILKQYFLLYLSILQSLVLERSQKKGVTVESVNTDDFKSVPIVCPPIEVQNKIVNYISGIKEQINTLRIEAIANQTGALLKFEQKIFQ